MDESSPPANAKPSSSARGGAGPPRIANARALAEHGLAKLREPALAIAAAGLASAHPGAAVAEVVRLEGDQLVVDGVRHPLDPGDRVVVLGAGKASLAIAAALEEVLGDRLDGGAIAVKGRAEALRHVEVLEADHPLPGERSVAAGRRLMELAAGLNAGDIALCCFTGGSSALSAVPPTGVTVEDKRELHATLLAAGMPIDEMNAVRKHASASKGGRVAELAAPAEVINLTVSDVAHDRLDVLTDPSVPDTTTPQDAIAVLRDYGLWERMPASIRHHLDSAYAASPELDARLIQSVILASGSSVCDAMSVEATARGLASVVLSTTLQGEARWIGATIGNLARESWDRGAPFSPPCALLGCGGEGTVRLGPKAEFGVGGPNQEAALAAAAELAGAPVAALFIDTDGSDGSSDVAGGIVDGTTRGRADEAGLDLRAALLGHRATGALDALGDAVRTGATDTNVNDLFVVVVGED